MKKKYIIIIVAAVLAVIFLYSSDAKKSIFTERLGDMTLTSYETGETAGSKISGMDGLKDIPMAKAYFAEYKSKKGTMRIWAVEPPDHYMANDAFNSMNTMFGGSSGHDEHENKDGEGQTISSHAEAGMMNEKFTKPLKLDIMEFEIPEVFVMNGNNLNNYYYLKMNYNTGRIYWIIFDSPDLDYQISIVKQAVMDI